MEQTASFKLIILVLREKFPCCGIPRSILCLTVHHQKYVLRE